MHDALPPFPSGKPAPVDGRLVAAGLRLRPAGPADFDFLRQLHAEWQWPELASLPWTDTQKGVMIDSQFRLQHGQFVLYFGSADFWVVTDCHGIQIGRLYLDRSSTQWRLLDILLAAAHRDKGLGTRLIDWVQNGAASSGSSIMLHVAIGNARARRLYSRLGFADAGPDADAVHLRMEWCGPAPSSHVHGPSGCSSEEARWWQAEDDTGSDDCRI